MRRTVSVAAIGALALVGASCGDDDGGSAGGFCDEARALDEEFSDDFDISDDDTIEDALGALRDLADGAPSEIRSDLDTLIDGLESFAEGDFTALEADGEAFEAASANVEQYLEEECGITSDEE